MTDKERMWVGCFRSEYEEGPPGDMMVLADWYEEHDDPAVGVGIRWATGRGLRPLFEPDGERKLFHWFNGRFSGPFRSDPQSDLPAQMFRDLNPGGMAYLPYATPEEAYRAVGEYLLAQQGQVAGQERVAEVLGRGELDDPDPRQSS